MENSNLNYFGRYYNRVKKHRRKYFFERLNEISWKKNSSLKYVLKWVMQDFVFIMKWSANILLQIRRHGPIIRRAYGCSYWCQWKGLMYVMFRLRNYPRYYKSRLLFKEANWRFVDDFVFNHHSVLWKLAHLSSKDGLSTLKNKLEFYMYCVSNDIPTPDVLGTLEKGKVTYQKFDRFIPHSSIFIKNLSSGKGDRANKFDFNEGIYSDGKNSYTETELKSYLKEISFNKGPLIVQPVLKNHKSWMNFTPGSLATCRIVSARKPEEETIIPLFGCFRMPLGDMHADNYSIGGIIAPVDLTTGKLGVAVTSKPFDGKYEFTHHPNTHHPIEGEILPNWKNLVEFTLQVHRQFKTVFVGWDVSYTENGISMIEGNVGWASGSYEIPFQASLKNTIYPDLFEKWMEKYE